LRDQPCGARQLKREANRHVGRDRRRRYRIESLASRPRKQLAMKAVAWRTRWNEREHLRGNDEFRRLEGIRERLERLSLILRRLPFHGRTAVAAHTIGKVLSAEH